MYRYKMDPASIVDDTEWTLFRVQTEGQIDRRTWILIANFQI